MKRCEYMQETKKALQKIAQMRTRKLGVNVPPQKEEIKFG